MVILWESVFDTFPHLAGRIVLCIQWIDWCSEPGRRPGRCSCLYMSLLWLCDDSESLLPSDSSKWFLGYILCLSSSHRTPGMSEKQGTLVWPGPLIESHLASQTWLLPSLLVMASRGPERQVRWTKDNHLSLDTCWGPRSDLYGWSSLCQWTQYFCSLPPPPTNTFQSPRLGTGLSGLMSKAVSEWQGCCVPYPIVDPADRSSKSQCWAVSVSSRRTSPNITWFGDIIGQRHQQVSWLCLLGKTFWSGIQVRDGPVEGLHSLMTLVTLSPVL